MRRQRIGDLGRLVMAAGVLLACVLWLGGIVVEISTAQAQPYIYPAQGQSKEQQGKDEFECHQWAVEQTGFDPTKPPPATDPSSQPSRGGAVRGAAGGAALGAIGGAIAGDAGKGAAIGAAVGGAGGAMRQGRQNRQAQEQQEQAKQAYQQTLDGYNRAKAVCLQGRGYTVSQ